MRRIESRIDVRSAAFAENRSAYAGLVETLRGHHTLPRMEPVDLLRLLSQGHSPEDLMKRQGPTAAAPAVSDPASVPRDDAP